MRLSRFDALQKQGIASTVVHACPVDAPFYYESDNDGLACIEKTGIIYKIGGDRQMLTAAISFRRLRSYEETCRQCSRTELDPLLRAELSKFADMFRQRAKDLDLRGERDSDRMLAPD